MTVKQLIGDVLQTVGRADAAYSLSRSHLNDEENAIVNTLLLCLNAVCDELARAYFPLKATEEFLSDGCVPLSEFSCPPVRIVGVTCGNKQAKWTLTLEGITVPEGNVRVQYEYALPAFTLDDGFTYPDPAVGERLVKYGVIAEYYLCYGDAESSAAYEKRYREEIERILTLRRNVSDRIPPRRWV